MTETCKTLISEASKSMCPYCRDELEQRFAAICQSCETPQHLECFREHGSCSVHGCSGEELRFGVQTLPINMAWHITATPEEEEEEQELDRLWQDEQRFEKKTTKAVFLTLFFLIFGPFLMTPLVMLIAQGMKASSGILLGSFLAIAFDCVIIGKAWSYFHSDVKIRKNSTLSFWRDIMGQDGFDPIMGTNPLPRRPFEQRFIDNREP
jgi:hypothetical protein